MLELIKLLLQTIANKDYYTKEILKDSKKFFCPTTVIILNFLLFSQHNILNQLARLKLALNKDVLTLLIELLKLPRNHLSCNSVFHIPLSLNQQTF